MIRVVIEVANLNSDKEVIEVFIVIINGNTSNTSDFSSYTGDRGISLFFYGIMFFCVQIPVLK